MKEIGMFALFRKVYDELQTDSEVHEHYKAYCQFLLDEILVDICSAQLREASQVHDRNVVMSQIVVFRDDAAVIERGLINRIVCTDPFASRMYYLSFQDTQDLLGLSEFLQDREAVKQAQHLLG